MSSWEERLQELRREYSTQALAMSEEEVYDLVLKEVNRSRFFMQEAIDCLSPHEKQLGGLENVNVLKELTRETLVSCFHEQKFVLASLLEVTYSGLIEPSHRETIMEHLSQYTETLAKLHGLVSVHKLAHVFSGYNDLKP